MSRQAGGNGRAPEGAKIHHWTRMASRPIIPGQGCNASVVSRHLNAVAWRRHLNNGVAVSLPCFLRRSVRWRLQRVGHPFAFLPHAFSLKIPTLGNAAPCSEESWSLSLVTAVLPWSDFCCSQGQPKDAQACRTEHARHLWAVVFMSSMQLRSLLSRKRAVICFPMPAKQRLVPPGVGPAQ